MVAKQYGKSPFVIDKDATTLYVKAKYSGISPLIMAIDNMTLVFFGNEKTQYLKVSDVIAWHETELSETDGQSGNAKALEQFKIAQANFDAGKINES